MKNIKLKRDPANSFFKQEALILAIAEVLEDGTDQLKIVDPKYNEIMVGDTVKSLKKVIRQKVQLVRNISLRTDNF